MAVGAGTQLRDFARDCRRAGSPATGLPQKMRRNITAAVQPLANEVRHNAVAIATHSGFHTGLRSALASATDVSVKPLTLGTTVVSLIVRGSRMPAGQQSLPPYMEGSDGSSSFEWRHPVYGPHDSGTWAGQESHPFVAPAVLHHLPGIQESVVAAVDEVVALLAAKGI